MSRLAALKEFTFMKALRENGFPVPEPIAQSRHTIVMELIDAFPLRQIVDVPDPATLYSELIDMILRLAGVGLIHGDFNEFNILIKEEKKPPSNSDTGDLDTNPQSLEPSISLVPILIDFPQMVSIDHTNAAMYFDRDVNCIKRFFERRFHFTSDAPGPFFATAKKQVGKNRIKRLDVDAEASGFSKKMAKELEAYMREVGVDGDRKVEQQSGSETGDSGDSASEFDTEEESAGTASVDEALNGIVRSTSDTLPSRSTSQLDDIHNLSLSDKT